MRAPFRSPLSLGKLVLLEFWIWMAGSVSALRQPVQLSVGVSGCKERAAPAPGRDAHINPANYRVFARFLRLWVRAPDLDCHVPTAILAHARRRQSVWCHDDWDLAETRAASSQFLRSPAFFGLNSNS